MARQVRSQPEQDGAVLQRLTCTNCGLGWNRRSQPGRVPSYCSDSCKQANFRTRLGSQEYNKRRRAAEARRVRAYRLIGFLDEFERISAKSPLPSWRALPLLRELAGVEAWSQTPVSRLYRDAALTWHPDRPDGDKKVFQLLQEAYRLAKHLNP